MQFENIIMLKTESHLYVGNEPEIYILIMKSSGFIFMFALSGIPFASYTDLSRVSLFLLT